MSVSCAPRWSPSEGREMILRRLARGQTLFRNETAGEASTVVTWHTARVGSQVRDYAEWSAAEAEELVARGLVEEIEGTVSPATTRYRLANEGRP